MEVFEAVLAQTPSNKRTAAEFKDAGSFGDPRKLARRMTRSPGDEMAILCDRGRSDCSTDFAFTAEAVATLAPDYIDSEPKEGIKAATASVALVPVEFRRREPDEDLLIAEVQRIRSAGVSDDYRRVFDLHPGECWDLPTIQSRYRSLMRLLHPDKRGIQAEALAGGRECCDEAIAILQRAVDQAKREVVGKNLDPRLQAQQDMRRMQEIQRTRARQAMQRHYQSQASSLADDIDRALAACPRCGCVNCSQTECLAAARAQPDPTSQKIMEALAQLTH